MRTLALSFAVVVCLAMSARAQAPVDDARQQTVSRDLLVNNVYVDMTPAKVGQARQMATCPPAHRHRKGEPCPRPECSYSGKLGVLKADDDG